MAKKNGTTSLHVNSYPRQDDIVRANNGHPVFTRYPHLLDREMSHKITKEFAWLPITTLHGRRVWLEPVVKTKFKTISMSFSPFPSRRKTTFYETFDEIAQRKLSNEN